MKKILSLTLAAILMFSMLTMFGCGKATGLDAIKKAGKLTIYTEAGFAPYEFVYNNEIVGVDIEIMKAVADKIGVALDVQDTNFDAIIGGVQSGKVNAGAAGAGMSVGAYLIIAFVGLNFVFELLANIVLSPAIYRILNIKKKF